MLVPPPATMLTVGFGLTVTTTVSDVAEHPPKSVPVTAYLPAVDTSIETTVWPVLHSYVSAPIASNVIWLPSQKVVLAPSMTVINIIPLSTNPSQLSSKWLHIS